MIVELLEFAGTFAGAWLVIGNLSPRFQFEATARLKFRRGLLAADTVGCDYRDPDAHRVLYPPGAVHLCGPRCVHEPPEER